MFSWIPFGGFIDYNAGYNHVQKNERKFSTLLFSSSGRASWGIHESITPSVTVLQQSREVVWKTSRVSTENSMLASPADILRRASRVPSPRLRMSAGEARSM